MTRTLTEQLNWIDIKNELPPLYKRVLLYIYQDEIEQGIISTGYKSDGSSWQIDTHSEGDIIHWMPLPPPPKEQL